MQKRIFMHSMDAMSNMSLDCALLADAMSKSENEKVVEASEAVSVLADKIFSRAQRSIIALHKAEGVTYKLINFKATKAVRATKMGRFSGTDEQFLHSLITKGHEMKNELVKHGDNPVVMTPSGKKWRKTNADNARVTEMDGFASEIIAIAEKEAKA